MNPQRRPIHRQHHPDGPGQPHWQKIQVTAPAALTAQGPVETLSPTLVRARYRPGPRGHPAVDERRTPQEAGPHDGHIRRRGVAAVALT